MNTLTLKPASHRHLWVGAALAVLMLLALTIVALPAQADSSATLQASNVQPGKGPTLSGTGFTPNERVDLWLTSPSGQAVGYGYTYADVNGAFSSFSTMPAVNTSDSASMIQAEKLDMPGQWYVTARGTTSDASVITPFQVVSATLTASLYTVNGDQAVVELSGGNFYPNEVVALWITDSAGTVIPLNYVVADNNGNIPMLDPAYSGTWPQNVVSFTATAGSYYLSAHGNSSGQTIYTQVSGS